MEDMVVENEGCLHVNQRAELVRDLWLCSGQRILLSWQDDMLSELLKQKQPDIQIDVLMNGDFVAFVSEKKPDSMVKYNCILDNGLLAQVECDGNLVRAMGMHLVPGGGSGQYFLRLWLRTGYCIPCIVTILSRQFV